MTITERGHGDCYFLVRGHRMKRFRNHWVKKRKKDKKGIGFIQDMLMNRPEMRKNESLGSRVRRENGMEA